MLVIGENLKQLASNRGLCDSTLIDEFSLRIRLGEKYYSPSDSKHASVIYNNHPDPKELFSGPNLISQNLELAPGAAVIGSSSDIYNMPLDHFGLVQTKGTLGRIFVQITCCDGQIEPGFKGYITLEIVNLSPWTVHIPKFASVGQLLLFKASTEVQKGYSGRYSELALEGPTIPVFTLDR